MTHSAWGVVLATGKSQELATGAEVAFLGVGSRPVLAHVLRAFEECRDIEGVVVVASRERMEMVNALSVRFGCGKLRSVVPGQASRRANVEAALEYMGEEDVGVVAIQEVSFPCVTSGMISAAVALARRGGGGIVATPLKDVAKIGHKSGQVKQTWQGGDLWVAQSPQAFPREILVKALQMAGRKHLACEEESELVERLATPVRMAVPDRLNLRIRTADDLALAAQLLR